MLPKIQNKKLILFPKLDFDAAAGIPFQYRMNFDGCSKGNPGLSGAGAVIYKNNQEIWSQSFFVGKRETNNRAEYAGLILGLQEAVNMGITCLHVQGDSQLVINQMKGVYQCNSPNLVECYELAKDLVSKFEKIEFTRAAEIDQPDTNDLNADTIIQFLN